MTEEFLTRKDMERARIEGYNQAIDDADKVLDWIGEVCHPLDAIMQGKEKLKALRKKVK